jgi:hypothetical protein
MKHNPEYSIDQARIPPHLLRWRSGQQGQKVLRLLLAEMLDRISPRPGDLILEIAPLSCLADADLQPAHLLRIGSAEASIRVDPGALPLPSERCIALLLGFAGRFEPQAERVLQEAIRVLAPEGYLFLLESNLFAADGARHRWRRPWPIGWKRWRTRRQLQASGLHVHAQHCLSLLPASLPPRLHTALLRSDGRACTSPWIGVMGTQMLTIAHRREPISWPPRSRLRWSPATLRAGRTSQWARGAVKDT